MEDKKNCLVAQIPSAAGCAGAGADAGASAGVLSSSEQGASATLPHFDVFSHLPRMNEPAATPKPSPHELFVLCISFDDYLRPRGIDKRLTCTNCWSPPLLLLKILRLGEFKIFQYNNFLLKGCTLSRNICGKVTLLLFLIT